jgi:hypothetical protein
MKVIIPENLVGKELFKFLMANKGQLIAAKKAAIKTTDSVVYDALIITPIKSASEKAAGENGSIPEEAIGFRTLDVKVVANTAWYCDSQMDVLTDKCYDKSIKEKGNLIPHIADHIRQSTNHVGDVKKVYTQSLSLKELGYQGSGSTTALIFETTVREDYNEDTYKFYKNGKIKQHSIGLIYVSIGLCINDKEYLPEYELWNKYYEKVINKDVVDEKGYFWIVPEIKVMENSCVLFGSNQLTPTLDAKADTDDQPTNTVTDQQPSTEKNAEGVDWDKIANLNFLTT